MVTELTTRQAESTIEAALASLKNAPMSADIKTSLSYLVPDGYSPVVQIEDGRRRRGSADSAGFDPATGKIVIYFEPLEQTPAGNISATQPRQSTPTATPEPEIGRLQSPEPTPVAERALGSSEEERIQCCKALAEAEKAGKHFIALKWFRDDYLPTCDFTWVSSPERRAAIVTHAIECGWINTKKIPNPKAPQFPTTTISLNRAVEIAGIRPRFRPVPVRGEPGSVTLLRDRGAY